MERIAEKIKIDSFTLKMIAMLSMLADHIGAVLFPEQILFGDWRFQFLHIHWWKVSSTHMISKNICAGLVF